MEIIDKYIKQQKKELKKIKADFEKYDNIEDMHMIDNIEYALEILKQIKEESH